MPLDNTSMAAEALSTDVLAAYLARRHRGKPFVKVDYAPVFGAETHRLLIRYQRVTKRDAKGVPLAVVHESFNLAHPDDKDRKGQKGFNTFQELGHLFRGNSDFINVTYDKLEAV